MSEELIGRREFYLKGYDEGRKEGYEKALFDIYLTVKELDEKTANELTPTEIFAGIYFIIANLKKDGESK